MHFVQRWTSLSKRTSSCTSIHIVFSPDLPPPKWHANVSGGALNSTRKLFSPNFIHRYAVLRSRRHWFSFISWVWNALVFNSHRAILVTACGDSMKHTHVAISRCICHGLVSYPLNYTVMRWDFCSKATTVWNVFPVKITAYILSVWYASLIPLDVSLIDTDVRPPVIVFFCFLLYPRSKNSRNPTVGMKLWHINKKRSETKRNAT